MSVFLSFHGAAHAVTGSCFRLETSHGQVLFDCGLFQGSKTEKELNYQPFSFSPEKINAVVLSHAHIDHSGLLPKLVKEGFQGPIYATPATADLAAVMLPDSAYIQEIEVKQLNKRNARRARARVEPIYSAEDVLACLEQFRPAPYAGWFNVTADVKVRLWNAGHLLGSASIEVEVHNSDTEHPLRIVFSGDIGPNFKLLHPNPEAPRDLDYIVCEGTYGDRDRATTTPNGRRMALRDEVLTAQDPNGVLLIPSFAIERAQELIADLVQLMEEGALPAIPIYVDSPLATKASHVFARHAKELESGEDFARRLKSRNVHFTETVEQSKALDRLRGFHIVIAASGMCEAGRIRYRLKNWIWRDEATILLVGFQAQGTLGRILQDGAASVRIQGEEFKVRARVRSLDLYSGHADGPELKEWIRMRLPLHQTIFLVHGEKEALTDLQTRLQGLIEQKKIILPEIDESFELTAQGARPMSLHVPSRADKTTIAQLDWHNEASRLVLDINDALAGAPDNKARVLLIKRLREALNEAVGQNS